MKPRISLCVIAKDEEQNIGRALASVKPWVDQIIVVDTGSADQTVAIAQAAGADVCHLPWTGSFAHARNHGLDQATGDWVLVLDADEELDQATAPNLTKLIATKEPVCYSVLVHSFDDHKPDIPFLESYAQRLFPRRPDFRWQGRIHEQVIGPGLLPRATRDIKMLHYGYLSANWDGRGKAERNITLLQAAIKEHDETFDYFCLGKELYVAERFIEALLYLGVVIERAPAFAYLAYAYSLAVGCCLSLGELARGITIGEMGISALHYADLWFNLGSCHFHSGQTDQAIECYGQAILAKRATSTGVDSEIAAHEWRAWEYLGIAYAAKGELVRAVESYLAAEASCPSRPEPRLRASACLAALGETGMARQFMQDVATKWPGDPRATMGLAKLAEMEGSRR